MIWLFPHAITLKTPGRIFHHSSCDAVNHISSSVARAPLEIWKYSNYLTIGMEFLDIMWSDVEQLQI